MSEIKAFSSILSPFLPFKPYRLLVSCRLAPQQPMKRRKSRTPVCPSRHLSNHTLPQPRRRFETACLHKSRAYRSTDGTKTTEQMTVDNLKPMLMCWDTQKVWPPCSWSGTLRAPKSQRGEGQTWKYHAYPRSCSANRYRAGRENMFRHIQAAKPRNLTDSTGDFGSLALTPYLASVV